MSLRLDGSTQYVLAPAPITDYPYTVSALCWIDDLTPLVTSAIVALTDGSVTNMMDSLEINTDGTFRCHFNGLGGSASPVSTGNVVREGWNHVLFERAGDADRSVILNGDFANLGNSTVNRDLTGMDTLAIGCLYRLGGGRLFGGRIAEVAVWNGLLSRGEWAQLANRQSPATIRSAQRVFHAPLARRIEDVARGTALTPTASPYIDPTHPRMSVGSFGTRVPGARYPARRIPVVLDPIAISMGPSIVLVDPSATPAPPPTPPVGGYISRLVGFGGGLVGGSSVTVGQGGCLVG